MMRSLSIAWALVLLGAGCADGGDTTGGTFDFPDGAYVLDSGTGPSPGPPGTGTDGGSGSGDSADAGTDVVDTDCAIEWRRPPTEAMPRCEASTKACARECLHRGAEASACVVACVNADAHPPAEVLGETMNCAGCLASMQMACLSTNGCDAQLGALACCALPACGSFDGSCVASACPSEMAALQECATYDASSCGVLTSPEYDGCYAP